VSGCRGDGFFGVLGWQSMWTVRMLGRWSDSNNTRYL